MIKRFTKGIVFLTLILLVGCGSDRKEALEAYVKDVKSKSIGQVDPLPNVVPYETFLYSAQDLRSPFEPPVREDGAIGIASDNGIAPDPNRRKEPLESYPLDSLRMVGTLEKDNKRWALVLDTDGVVHRITVGNYVGQNYGKVNVVSEEDLKITEIIPNVGGGWIEREASMTLVE